jgi:hypothetical protein
MFKKIILISIVTFLTDIMYKPANWRLIYGFGKNEPCKRQKL